MCECVQGAGGRCEQTLITILFIDLCTFFFFSPCSFCSPFFPAKPSSSGLDPSYLLQLVCFTCLPSPKKKKNRKKGNSRLSLRFLLCGLGAFPLAFVPSFDLRRLFHFVTRPKVPREQFCSRQRRLSASSRPSLLV